MMTLVLPLLLIAAPSREVVNFDFAWRHRLGEAGPSASLPSFDDSTWSLVNAPHDMLLPQNVSIASPGGMGYRARGTGWYRKHFVLPKDWEGSAVWLYIEGACALRSLTPAQRARR